MYCARCGTPCREDEIFCAHCGAALQAEGGRVEKNLSTAPAPAVETPVETPVPAARERRFSLRLPRLSRRNRLLLGGSCLVLAVVLLAARTALTRPAGGFQAKPAALLSIQGEDETGSQYFYYDGALVAGPEEHVMGLSLFLDGESCLAVDTDGNLNGVITADGVVELDLPEGTMTGYAASADGSTLYYATAKDMLWRISLPDGAAELVAEGCAVNDPWVSPSGDAAAYFDLNTDVWYLVRGSAAPEALPLPEDAAVLSLSDGGRYVYYLADSRVTSGTSAVLEVGGYLYCWDGAASHLVGYTESFNTLTNRTGDQLLLMGSSGTYLVEGTENRFWPGAFFPLWLLQKSGSSGIYTGSGITVVNCADLTRGHFVSSEYLALYRMEGDALTPVLEETDIFYLGADAAGEVLWYVRDGDLWQFRDGRSTLQWEDIGGEASLRGASPDGDIIVVYQSGNGLCRLTAGGTLELLEGGHYPYPFWNGFYFEDGDRLYYAPWEGTPELVEELDGVQGISSVGASPLRVELRDGSVWHVIDGRDPIRITPPASS